MFKYWLISPASGGREGGKKGWMGGLWAESSFSNSLRGSLVNRRSGFADSLSKLISSIRSLALMFTQ